MKRAPAGRQQVEIVVQAPRDASAPTDLGQLAEAIGIQLAEADAAWNNGHEQSAQAAQCEAISLCEQLAAILRNLAAKRNMAVKMNAAAKTNPAAKKRRPVETAHSGNSSDRSREP